MNQHQIRQDAIAQYGDAPATPQQALAHVVAVFADSADATVVLQATSNVYGPGVRTGLTMGDLRALLAQLTAPATTAAEGGSDREVWGGDPNHAHTWTWTEDDGNGHMGHVCSCTAFRL